LLRGVDNPSYYYLLEGEARHYNDFTGTGNTLDLLHPNVLRMVTDSLRYWVEEMRVAGFRFDLATTLARVNGRARRASKFSGYSCSGSSAVDHQAHRRALGQR